MAINNSWWRCHNGSSH